MTQVMEANKGVDGYLCNYKYGKQWREILIN